MEMVDRYVYAVTKHLPQSQRKDINKELNSLIFDMIDERNDALDQKAVVHAVLRN